MRFLIVKTSSLGDIVHSFPVVSYLKKKFPDCQVDWVIEKPFADLVKSHPLVDGVLIVDTKVWRKAPFASAAAISAFLKELKKVRYDAVFDLQGNTKASLITWQARAKDKIGFGKVRVTEWPNCLATNHHFDPPWGNNIRDDYLFLVQSYFNDFATKADQQVMLKATPLQFSFPTDGPKVMICPGSAWPNKQLSTATLKRFMELVQKDTGCFFVLTWGSEGEKKMVEELAKVEPSLIIGRQTLPVLQWIMRDMDLVVGMDSMALHLAGAAGVSTFSVFGPSLATKYPPHNGEAYQGSCPYGRTFKTRCDILRKCPTGACIKNIQGDELFEYFKGTRAYQNLCSFQPAR